MEELTFMATYPKLYKAFKEQFQWKQIENDWELLAFAYEYAGKEFQDEHSDIVSRPTVLAAHLAGLGFKGTLTREQPFFNSNISMDKRVGLYTETLKVE